MLPWRIVLGVAIGAMLGFAYHRVVGCRSGVCVITARWWSATLYGAMLGFFLTRT